MAWQKMLLLSDLSTLKLTLPLLNLLLLHVAGELVYDNYDTLAAKDAKYADTMQKLSIYFSPKKYVQFMYIFRKNMQEQGENLDSFHTD